MVKKGTEYVCGSCGTTLLIVEGGGGCLEELVCCEMPMTKRQAVKPRATKKASKKTVKRKR